MEVNTVSQGARLAIRGTLEFKDKDGRVIGTTEMHGSVPLADTGLTADEAQQIIDSQQIGRASCRERV